jgi:hypothetical protein
MKAQTGIGHDHYYLIAAKGASGWLLFGVFRGLKYVH